MIEVSSTDLGHVLTINDELLIASPCRHVCERAARILNQARSSTYREAMRLLTQEIGFCDSVAEHVYSSLFGATHNTVN